MKVKEGMYMDLHKGVYRYFYRNNVLWYIWLSGGHKGRSSVVTFPGYIERIKLHPIDSYLKAIIYDVEDLWSQE